MSDYPYEAIVFLGDKDEIVEYTGEEIVRCKDCKRRYVGGNGLTHYWVCDFLDAENKDDGYCSYGERAEQ